MFLICGECRTGQTSFTAKAVVMARWNSVKEKPLLDLSNLEIESNFTRLLFSPSAAA